jgi:small conductance mechanosensitive channel
MWPSALRARVGPGSPRRGRRCRERHNWCALERSRSVGRLEQFAGGDGLSVLALSGPWNLHGPLVDALAALGVAVGGALGVLVLTYVVARILSHRMQRTLLRTGFHANVSILLSRALWIALWSVGIIWILYLFGVGLTPLAAFIGVVGLAASLSLQTLLQNLVAGVYLLAERPFRLGDTIAVVGPAGVNHVGTVEDVQMRTTHLRGLNDELILVPNASIFSGVVTNRTVVGGQAATISLTFPRDTDLDAARESIFSLLREDPAVLVQPKPEMRVETADRESWHVCLTFWSSREDAASQAVWSLGQSFPVATVSGVQPAS